MKTSRFGFMSRVAVPVLFAALALPVGAQSVDESAPQTPSAIAGSGSGPGMGKGRMRDMRCPLRSEFGPGMQRHYRGLKSQRLRMPRLPPGNDKLQLQMEAEILQKIGEIQGKYASQLP